MPRVRDLHPGFFQNEDLCGLPPHARLLFEGLWCWSDRDGKVEDRPSRLRAWIFPYEPDVPVEQYLAALADLGFITRYQVDGTSVIRVVQFAARQHPHPKEIKSKLPDPYRPTRKPVASNRQETGKQPASRLKAGEEPVKSPADVSFPSFPSDVSVPESVAVPSAVPGEPDPPATATDSLSGLNPGTATAEPQPDDEDPRRFELPEDLPPETPETATPETHPSLGEIDGSHRSRVVAEGILRVTQELARSRGNESIRDDLDLFVPLGTWGAQMRPVIRAPRAAAERVLAWVRNQVAGSAAESLRKRLLIVEDESP